MISDGWFRWGYYSFYAKLYSARFELLPLAVMHSIILTHDSCRVCPRRDDWQLQCPDSRCFDCDQFSLNIADLDLRLTSGQLGRLIAVVLPNKSGVRRSLITEQHGNVPLGAIDLDRMKEQDYDEFFYIYYGLKYFILLLI